MPGTVHVYPVDDLIEHDLRRTDCMCGPEAKPVTSLAGVQRMQVTHRSLDGREQTASPAGAGWSVAVWDPITT